MKANSFFTKYQKQILWFANTRIGKRWFKIDRKEKLILILPNAIRWIDGDKYKSEFRTSPKYAIRLRRLISWFPFTASFERDWYLQPRLGFTTSTFYPDASPESTSVDGYTGYDDNSGATWATVHDEPGTGGRAVASDSATVLYARCDQSGSSSSFVVFRSIILFDTSSLPDGDDISAVTLDLWGTTIVDNHSDSVGIVQSNPDSNTAVATTDYDSFTVHEDTATATLSLASQSTGAYNTFTFDATGRGWVSKTGITKLGFRMQEDYSETTSHSNPPASSVSLIQYSSADETGTSQDPKLTVTHGATYTLTCDAGSYALTGVAASLLKASLLTCAAGSYALSGVAAGLKRALKLACDVGSYILTGIDITFKFTGWLNQAKNSTSWTESSKNSTSWTEGTKNSTNWTKQSKS